MSSVFKLSIKGVRSFDPIETETIEFNKPLTLIVGANGSGKTSIIECLKFATTGDLPPNSKGGAFIHDPNIGGEKSVVAQIKLAFNNINNKNMILTKTLQLINKKTSNTFKTLENQLVVLNNGERVTISTKAADIEQLVPQFLGVTKSILSYVIFCHQEDSLWPISEPAVLKKRFDEIFDSVKFIKVLDNFKDLRKQFNEDIKLLTNNVEHLKQDRRRANNKRMEKEDLETTIATYKEEIDELSTKLEQTTSRMDELFKSNQDYEAVINKVDSLQAQNVSLKNQIQKLTDNIEFLSDSDQELQNKLNNFNDIQSQQRTKIDVLRAATNSISELVFQKHEEYSANIRLEGELKSLKTQFEKNVLERQNLMEQNDLDMLIPENASDETVNEYKNKLQHTVETSSSNLDNLLKQHEASKSELEEKITRIRDSKMKEDQHLKYYTEDIENLRAVNQSIDSNIKAIRVDESDLTLEKEELQNLKSEFEIVRNENDVATLTSKISSINKDIQLLESDIDELNRQISSSNKRNEVVTRVQLTGEQFDKTKKKLSILIADNAAEFEAQTGKPLQIENCRTILSESLELAKEEKSTELAELDMISQDLFEQTSHAKTLQQEVHELQNQLDTKLKRIKLALPEDVDIADYEEYLNDLQSDFNTVSENFSLTEVTVKFNEAAINSATKDHYCLLCRRGFEEKEVSKFLVMLKEHNDKIKSGNDSNQKEQLRTELEEVKNLQHDVTRARALEEREIKELKSKVVATEAEVRSMEAKQAQQKKLLDALNTKISSLESLNITIRELERVEEERKSFESEMKSLKNELYGVEIKSISKLQEEQEGINNTLKKKRRELSDLLDSKEEATKRVSRLELKINEKSLVISNREKDLIDLRNLKKQKEENDSKVQLLSKTVALSQNAVLELENDLQLNNEAYAKLKEAMASEEKDACEVLARYTSLLDKFTRCTFEIDDYISNDSLKLEACLKNSIKLESDIKSAEREIEAKNVVISELEKVLADADRTLRNIRDNIDIRSLESELNSNTSIIEELEAQNARISRENYQKETNELNQEFSEMKSQHAMKNGEILQLTKQIQAIDAELKKDYKNIEKKYNEEFLRLQTKFFVNNDLTVYSKALDTAIMKFHSLKMKEINEIIDQLWRVTYSGSDVDTILIKSENNTVGVKSGNRSYNYRVVMIKQGAELDMRGRCSAGQKVLASIIIRLALAECFGVNFGMITLDEPTTNLDEDNIESLARSLNQIIEMRQKQKNFQLIVITHDEKFLKNMGAARFTDLYYRVSRDERQTSVIEAVPIAVIND